MIIFDHLVKMRFSHFREVAFLRLFWPQKRTKFDPFAVKKSHQVAICDFTSRPGAIGGTGDRLFWSGPGHFLVGAKIGPYDPRFWLSEIISFINWRHL